MHFDNKVVVRTDIPMQRVVLHYCGHTAGWMKTPLGTEVDLCAGHIVLDGFPVIRERGTAPPPFRPMSIVATVAHLSCCWALVMKSTVLFMCYDVCFSLNQQWQMSRNCLQNKFYNRSPKHKSQCWSGCGIFALWHNASTVYAIVMCLSVTSWCSVEMAKLGSRKQCQCHTMMQGF